jgi:hypothetical protein
VREGEELAQSYRQSGDEQQEINQWMKIINGLIVSSIILERFHAAS